MQHFEPFGLELHADQVSGFEIVFHDERGAHPREHLENGRNRRFRRDQRPGLRRPQRQPDREGRALAHGTFDRHRAAVQLGEEFHQG